MSTTNRQENYAENLKLILGKIETTYATKLAENLGWSKQKLNYWLHRFEDHGLLKGRNMGAYAQYNVTERGRLIYKQIFTQVKKAETPEKPIPVIPKNHTEKQQTDMKRGVKISLDEAEGLTKPASTEPIKEKKVGVQAAMDDYITEPLFDIHNYQSTIPITKIGKLPKGNIHMKNWSYSQINVGGWTVNVNYGKSPNLVVTIPKQKGISLPDILIKDGMKVHQILAQLQRKYDCDFDTTHIKTTKKPHIHAFKDPIARELAKHIKYTGVNLEVNESGGSHMDLLGFDAAMKYDRLINDVPDDLDAISMRLDRIENSMVTFAVAMDQHVRLIESIQKLVDELRMIKG